jgi:predicted HTH transcriptional regulator
LLTVTKALFTTVKFKDIAYIRVGSYKKQLKDHPAIERQLWNNINNLKAEEMYAKQNLSQDDILQLVDYPVYFDLLNISLPGSINGILHYLAEEKIISRQDNGMFAITNLGAILFAKRINLFDTVSRKAVRVIQYKAGDRTQTSREISGKKGYAAGFEALLSYISGLLPEKEEITGNGLRHSISFFPYIAVRELVANALIHQDLSITGTGPIIEIFNNRIEITNPGKPLVEINRFIDNPPISRNEMLASLMRRANICEERGSGWDKIAVECEKYKLPAPKIDIYKNNTKVTIFSHIPFNKLSLEEKLWSCYMHACLNQVRNEKMTNTTLRERFDVSEGNKAAISRLIAMTVKKGLIKPLDPDTAPRYMSYIPFWA